ncbi:hypothetical protein [Variovorax sp. UMC13]|uniref:hypothetical protein n=1 Tax=Variovorax sp. UMC13 TaxID=1862326 RepID=UPI0015FF06A6|nr:hypothetical protein [Variovorax sp. UMC13]MBB1602689.1 hypothetical protein [Variovorax sp. UMC13]
MDHRDRILNIVTIADHGEGLMKPSEAVRVIADLIERLDSSCESYAQETEALLRIGATVWHQGQRPCESGHPREAAPPLPSR